MRSSSNYAPTRLYLHFSNQKAKYDSDYVSAYQENGTSFEDVLQDVETLFGLKQTGAEDDTLVLTAYEVGKLKTAYEATMNPDRAKVDPANQAEYILYGTYEPLSVTITHLLNNKSGINFSSYAHTGLPVAVFAQGAGQDQFGGVRAILSFVLTVPLEDARPPSTSRAITQYGCACWSHWCSPCSLLAWSTALTAAASPPCQGQCLALW